MREDFGMRALKRKDILSTIIAGMVKQKEMELRTARGQEDLQRTKTAINDIRDGLVPRAEHERVWANYDQRFQDQQRQVDELKQARKRLRGERRYQGFEAAPRSRRT